MSAMAMTADDFDGDEAAPMSRTTRFLVGTLALVMAAAAVWGFFRVTGDRPVARLLVEGELHQVRVGEIEQAVRPLLEMRFVEVDLDAVRDAVRQVPWVARVRAEREWPATVRVRLWERQPVARWGDGELLDGDAAAFAPAGRDVPPTLPLLSGPEGSAARVLATYRQLAGRLEGSLFALQGLSEDARGDWTGTTRTGVELRFGRADPKGAVDMLLGPASRALANDLAAVDYVDLRYTNGFSVGWREPAAATKRN